MKWPDDLLGDLIPKDQPLSDLPHELKETLELVIKSALRFDEVVKRQRAPKISGYIIDLAAIRALRSAMNRQDELEIAIKMTEHHPTEPLLLWLRERKKSYVKSMQAVVVAEEGEMYDEASKQLWEVKLSEMTDKQVDRLRVIFRTARARISLVVEGEEEIEKVEPDLKTKVTIPGADKPNFLRPPLSVSFWKIDKSLMEGSTTKMRRAASALYHQGRVLTAGRNKMPVNPPEPVPRIFLVVMRAMILTIRSVELVWAERQVDLPEEEERRLLLWLRERKDAAVDVQLALTELYLPIEYSQNSVRIYHSKKIPAFENDGQSESLLRVVMDPDGLIFVELNYELI